jgi:hypothetical protein
MRKLSHLIPGPDWWTAVFSGMLAVTALGALWYARVQIREARELAEIQTKESRHQAQIQHLVTLENEFNQEPMATYRRGLAEKRLRHKNVEPLEMYKVLIFFDTVGLLVERGYLNDEDVWSVFGYLILNLNADSDIRATIQFEREHHPYEYTSYLALVDCLERIDVEHHGPASQISDEELMDFYQGELTIVGGTTVGTHPRSTKPSQ